MRLILLYANPQEVRWIKYKDKICIGQGAKNLPRDPVDAKVVFLFGCCGALKRLPLNRFYVRFEADNPIIAHAKGLVHSKECADQIRKENPQALLVDRETHIVAKWCKKWNIPFVSVRYIIDFCEYKAKPKGINHFWRIYQHWRMQRRFSRMFEYIYFEEKDHFNLNEFMQTYFINETLLEKAFP